MIWGTIEIHTEIMIGKGVGTGKGAPIGKGNGIEDILVTRVGTAAEII